MLLRFSHFTVELRVYDSKISAPMGALRSRLSMALAVAVTFGVWRSLETRE